MTDDERDLIRQQVQELSAELELLKFDRENGRITGDQFVMDLAGIKTRERSLVNWVIREHDEFERNNPPSEP